MVVAGRELVTVRVTATHAGAAVLDRDHEVVELVHQVGLLRVTREVAPIQLVANFEKLGNGEIFVVLGRGVVAHHHKLDVPEKGTNLEMIQGTTGQRWVELVPL